MTRRKSAPIPGKVPALEGSKRRFESLLEPAEYQILQEELKSPLQPGLRVNRLKLDPDWAVKDWKSRYNWDLTPVPFSSTGFTLPISTSSPARTIEHRLGMFYLQDVASMLPPELFTFQNDFPLVLDLAASPGGKTTHLVDRVLDRGLIIANDSSASRIQALRIVLQTWGSASTVVTQFPGEQFGDWFPDLFDAVLLDAPCSMEGLRATSAHKLRSITDGERSRLAARQASLLDSALRSVRPAGQVVYSTCTLSPEEDEAVVQAMLDKYHDSIDLVDLQSTLPIPAPGLTRNFSPKLARTARLWPHLYHTAGFFSALFIKKDSLLVEIKGYNPPISQRSVDFKEMHAVQVHGLKHYMKDIYGFDLEHWLEHDQLELVESGRETLVVPIRMLQTFTTLPLQMAGMVLGEQKPQGWELSHAAAARLGHLFEFGKWVIPEDQMGGWLLGQDAMTESSGLPRGTVVIVKDVSGRNLGRGRVLQDRIKNLLPRRLF